MNATSLYVSTSRLIFQADPEDSTSWSDLYRLIPYLRQSLSCTVCGNLLIEPYTPTETNCQHHVCRSCKGRKKKLKPSCSWCKDYDKYVENVQLRILLQCYKKLCEYVANSSIYRRLLGCNTNSLVGGSNLIDLIHEGSGFKDEFKSSSQPKTTFNIVPSAYTSTSTQTANVPPSGALADYSVQINNKDDKISTVNSLQSVVENNGIEHSIDNPTVYSVMYGGCGSKLTLKRSAGEIKSEEQQIEMENIPIIEVSEKTVQNALRLQTNRRRARNNLKKSPHNSVKGITGGSGSGSSSAKIGCRCGNATATPGKLTCCGQRCPCYIDSKACINCKCRGCRNPHTSDGHKIRPVIPDLQNYLHLDNSNELTALSASQFPITSADVPISIVPASSATVQVVGMYTTQLHNVSSSSTSSGILLDGNSVVTTDHDANDLSLEI